MKNACFAASRLVLESVFAAGEKSEFKSKLQESDYSNLVLTDSGINTTPPAGNKNKYVFQSSETPPIENGEQGSAGSL